MSKSNMLLGLAKGKVGDLVFYRDGGEQRTRTRVIPKNPRTPAQMTQRSKIANVSALYRALSAVVAESFTNRPSNQSGYNAFASVAIGLAPYMTKSMANADVVLPQPALLSKGVLPPLDYVGAGGVETSATAIAVTAELEGTASVGELSQAILAQYPYIQQGDKFTFVSVRFEVVEGVDAGVDVYAPVLSLAELVVDTTDTTTIAAAGLSLASNTLTAANIAASWANGIAMQGVILSRVDESGALQTSTQWARLSENAQSLYDGYRTDAAVADAVESYMAGSESILR